jgi:hypothetical protein
MKAKSPTLINTTGTYIGKSHINVNAAMDVNAKNIKNAMFT